MTECDTKLVCTMHIAEAVLPCIPETSDTPDSPALESTLWKQT